MDKKKLILRNDVKKRRQQLNFSISRELHLDVKELHLRETKRKYRKRFNLSEFYEMIIAKGVREWLNQ